MRQVRILKTQTINTIAYCYNLLSFAFQKSEISKKIHAVHLFGSAVRSELTKRSDIDLFVECAKEDEEAVQRGMESAIITFISSQDYEKWKFMKHVYPFSIQAGNLQEWDLKTSILSEGITLYTKRPYALTGKRSVLFVMTYPKEKKKYIKIRRMLFGRDEEYYKEKGIVYQKKGKKIGPNVFIIPKEEQMRIIDLLAEQKVSYAMKEIIEMGE